MASEVHGISKMEGVRRALAELGTEAGQQGHPDVPEIPIRRVDSSAFMTSSYSPRQSIPAFLAAVR